MFNWLRKLLGGGDPPEPAPPRPRDPARPAAPAAAEEPARPEPEPPAGPSPGSHSFLLALIHDAGEPKDLQELSPDDRVYLSGVLRMIRENAIEIPVLPQAALEISRLLGNPDVAVDAYVRVLGQDPALSIEVLRTANSAYYGFGRQTHSVKEAVVRIGLSQVRGLLVVAHLKGRVLQGGAFQREAGWLSDFSLAFAHLCRLQARDLGLEPDAAFTRGLLYHVEHFIVLGALGKISAEHKKQVRPSAEGLMEAFRRCGGRVRELSAQAWDLGDLLEGFDPEAEARIDRLRHCLVLHWVGAPVEDDDAPGIDRAKLAADLDRVSGAAGPGA